jgi:hypothetical protein
MDRFKCIPLAGNTPISLYTFFRWPGVNFRLGYHVRRVNFADKDVYYMNGETVEEDPSFWRKSISIGVGIIF